MASLRKEKKKLVNLYRKLNDVLIELTKTGTHLYEIEHCDTPHHIKVLYDRIEDMRFTFKYICKVKNAHHNPDGPYNSAWNPWLPITQLKLEKKLYIKEYQIYQARGSDPQITKILLSDLMSTKKKLFKARQDLKERRRYAVKCKQRGW